VLTGDTAYDGVGKGVAVIPDGDGDGVMDLAIGVPGDDDNGSSSGSVYLFSGVTTSGSSVALSDAYAQLTGDTSSGVFGTVVLDPGDGDGTADLLMGAYGAANAYLFLGPVTGSLGVASADHTFVGGADDDSLGRYNLWAAGDLDGDGLDDVLLGTGLYDGVASNSGIAYLFYGGLSAGSVNTVDADVIIDGHEKSAGVGKALAGLGDLDGDGQDDLGIGCHSCTNDSVFLHLGPISTDRDADDGDSTWTTTATSGSMGNSVGPAGDVNSDGYADFAVGASLTSFSASGAGSWYVVLGTSAPIVAAQGFTAYGRMVYWAHGPA
jgi:hypothetical protein